MRGLRSALRFVDGISYRVAFIASFIMAIWLPITVFDTIMRYFFRQPTMWAYELSGLLFGPFWLLGGAYVLSRNEHVSFELFHNKMSLRGQAITDVITYTLFFFYCGMILIFGWEHFMLAVVKNQHTSSIWAPPLAPFWFAIPLGTALILLQGIAKYVRDLYAAITGRRME